MPDLKRVGNIEIAEDMDFQQKEWLWVRVGWIAMLLVALAGLLGLFGVGPLSDTTTRGKTIEVRHGRFERLLAPVEYKVRISPENVKNGEVRMRIDETLLDAYNIQRVVPEPESVEVSPDYHIFVFKVGSEASSQPFHIAFHMLGDRVGVVGGSIGIENGEMVHLTQFVYP